MAYSPELLIKDIFAALDIAASRLGTRMCPCRMRRERDPACDGEKPSYDFQLRLLNGPVVSLPCIVHDI